MRDQRNSQSLFAAGLSDKQTCRAETAWNAQMAMRRRRLLFFLGGFLSLLAICVVIVWLAKRPATAQRAASSMTVEETCGGTEEVTAVSRKILRPATQKRLEAVLWTDGTGTSAKEEEALLRETILCAVDTKPSRISFRAAVADGENVPDAGGLPCLSLAWSGAEPVRLKIPVEMAQDPVAEKIMWLQKQIQRCFSRFFPEEEGLPVFLKGTVEDILTAMAIPQKAGLVTEKVTTPEKNAGGRENADAGEETSGLSLPDFRMTRE